MAKRPEPKLEAIEVTLVRKVGPERFDVLAGVITGPFEVTKVLDKNVTINVARTTAWKSMDRQNETARAGLCLPVKS